MKKKTSYILKGIGLAVAAGISMYGTRKANEKLCKLENEKTRIKETTEIGHLNDLEIEAVKINKKSGMLIYSDDSVLLFLDKIDSHKETFIDIEKFLHGKGIEKETFKGIIAASYSKTVTDIYLEENPELINMDENSILYNKPIFLPPNSNSVDFGIPIKVGRSVMISAGMASTGPIAFPSGIGKRIVKQGLLLNLRDKGLILVTADDGKNLSTTMNQISAFGEDFHLVILHNNESGNLLQKLGRSCTDETMDEIEMLADKINKGLILTGNHGIASTMAFKKLLGEDLNIVKFNEKLRI